MSAKETVGVVGLGYVGLPLALLAASKGYKVIGIDNDKNKVDLINKGRSPISDNQLEEDLKKTSLKASSDMTDLNKADIIVVCVPTPVKSSTPDLTILKSAVTGISKVMREGSLVIIESTVNPGVCDETILPIIVNISGLSEEQFHLAHCPERINPGDPDWSVKNINRVVGSNRKDSLDKAVAFYETIIDADIKRMDSIKEAEAVKVVENSFRDINIAFVNELAMSFHRMGINIENVIDGAATKPFAFMPHRPGCGVGGHCIPVDPYYLIEYARGFGFEHNFLAMARKINNQMPEFTIELLREAADQINFNLSNKTIGILGISYKPEVDDDRESPSYIIKKLLKDSGVEAISFDPFLLDRSDASSLDELLQKSDAIIIATNHRQFSELDPNELASHNIKIVVDGRNAYRHKVDEVKKAGITYRGIGIS